jgi:hypothetical protein
MSERPDTPARPAGQRHGRSVGQPIFLMIGNVGTAVVMFPILRRHSETLSLS